MELKKALLLIFSSLLAAFAFSIYQPLWPFLVEDAHVDPSLYGIIASGANLLEFLIRWMFAAFSSPSMTFLIGCLGISASSGVLLLGPSPSIILSSLSFSRVGRALSLMGRNQIVSILYRDKVGTAFGSVRVAWQIGAVAGPALGALLLLLLGRTGIFALGLMLGVVSALIVIPLFKEVPSRRKGKIAFWKGSLTPEIRGIVGLTVLNNFARNSFIPFHMVLAPAIFGAKIEHIALATVIERMVSLMTGVPIGWLSDRISDRRIILSLSELFMVSGIVMYILPGAGIPEFLVSTVLLGLGMASYAPIAMATVSELAPKNPEDAVAFLSTAVSFSRLPAPIITGFLISFFGYSSAFLLPMACLAIVGVSMLILSLKKRFMGNI